MWQWMVHQASTSRNAMQQALLPSGSIAPDMITMICEWIACADSANFVGVSVQSVKGMGALTLGLQLLTMH